MTARALTLIAALFVVTGCYRPARSGPDKTAGGAVMGAAWGAGAGAIVGNQVGNMGQGSAVGAGVGFVGGALQGAGYDLIEEQHARMESDLSAMRIQNTANSRSLSSIQRTLDRAAAYNFDAAVYQVYFDADASNLRAGAIANLEKVGESLKNSTHAAVVNIDGHADDAGLPEYNARLAEARARNVASYLAARGVATDSIVVRSFGSTRPVASNTTPEGRQLNRRVDVYLSRPERAAPQEG